MSCRWGYTACVPQSSNIALRSFLAVYAAALLAFAYGFAFQYEFATRFWPFPYSGRMGYIFIASIFAAAATSLLFVAIRNELAAMVGIGLDSLTIAAPVAIYCMTFEGAGFRRLAIALSCLAVAGAFVAIWFTRYPYRDNRPTPKPVLIGFGIFVAALVVIGGLMAMGNEHILFWQPTKESTRVYGWFFIGASMYFAYGLIVRRWGNGAGQLLAFLAYDIVLVLPFIQAYRTVAPEFWLAHVVYTTVIIVSGVFAFYWCFVHPTTRLIDQRPIRSTTDSA